MLVDLQSARWFLIVVAGAMAIWGIRAAAVYTWRNPKWLIFPLILVELLMSSVFFGGEEDRTFGTLGRYGLDLLFIAPALLAAWRSKLLNKGCVRLYVIYFAWAFVSVSWSLAPAYSAMRWLLAFGLFLAVVAIVSQVQNRDDVADVLSHYALGVGVIVGLVCAAALVLPHDITWDSGTDLLGNQLYVERFRGIFSGPNQVGELILPSVGLAILLWTRVTGKWRVGLIALIVASTAMALLADSRSPIGAVVAGCVLFGLWKYRARGVLVLVGVAALAAAAAVLLGKDFSDYVGRGDVGTLTGRTDVWKYAVGKIMERPVLGYGYETEGAIYLSKYFPLWWGPWDEGPHSSLHSGYLAHAVGVGLPATLLWLFLMVRPWAALFKRDDDPWNLKPIFFLIFVPCLIHNFVESSMSDCRYTIGILSVLTWAIVERERLLHLEQIASAKREVFERLPSGVAALVGMLVAGLLVTFPQRTALAAGAHEGLRVPPASSPVGASLPIGPGKGG